MNQFIQTAYAMTALGMGVYSIVFCLRVARDRGPKAAVQFLVTFGVMFTVLMFVVPTATDYAVANYMGRMQSGVTGQVLTQATTNGAQLVSNGISTINQTVAQPISGVSVPQVAPIQNPLPNVQLPQVAPAAPSAPQAAPQATQNQSATYTAPVTTVRSAVPDYTAAAPAPVAPAPAAVVAPVSGPAQAPAAWGNGLGTDNAGNAIAGPAAPANYAPLGTDSNGGVIQGPAPATWGGSPTIQTITKPDGGPAAAAVDAMAWGGSPTIQTIRQYQVQRGDTLFKIARRHYGNENRWVDICNANPMRNCNKLTVGMLLTLP